MAKPPASIAVRWDGEMTFTGSDSEGHSVSLDAGEPFQGFKPSQLLLVSLAGCTSADVVSILQKKRQDVTGMTVHVTGRQEQEPPWPFTEIDVMFEVHGRNLDEDAVERAIFLSESKYCSVSATIRGVAKIKTSYRIVPA